MEIKELEEKLESTLKVLKEDLNGIQVGQVSEKMLKNVTLSFENGVKNNIFELATIRVHGTNTLIVKPFIHEDLAIIEKGISHAGLGVNTGKQGHEIIVTFPPITTERREQLAKSVTEYGNKSKQSGRDIRHNYLKNNKTNTKEDQLKIEKELKPYMDKFNDEIEKLIKQKQDNLIKI